MVYYTRKLKSWIRRNSGYEHFFRWRQGKEDSIADSVWSDEQILNMEQTQVELGRWIGLRAPIVVGKIGANEQNLLHWALNVPIPTPIFGRRFIKFSQLSYCETNAGLKPRNRASYLSFAILLKNAVAGSDLLGIWRRPGEKALIRACGAIPLYTDFSSLSPFFSDKPWTAALEGKRVFIVSPFLDTIKCQMLKRAQLWPNHAVLPPMLVEGYKFPYLVSAGTSLSWQEVYDDVIKVMNNSNFEIGLFGCGALGLPLAAAAKHLGRQGIHLGGNLQTIFGIRGARWDRAPAFAKFVTPAWVRPSADETPPEAKEIEDGCYW
jgi:hypothetical protein